MKRYTRFLACVLFCFLLPVFSLAQTVSYSEDTKTLLRASIAETLLKNARLETPSSACISNGSDTYGPYFALRVQSGQIVKNGAASSELALDFPYKDGDVVRYSWRMKFPPGFSPDPNNHWWLVARWNPQPNTLIGERPEDFIGINPAMMIGYKFVDGQDSLYLGYGVPNSLSTVNFSLPRNEWIKLTIDVMWSRSTNGWAKLYVNDGKTPYREVSGRNMYGKYHNLFRLGSYRSADIRTDATVLYGDVKIQKIE